MHTSMVRFSMLLAGGMFCVAQADAAISVNIHDGTTLASTDVAGVVAQDNWNNISGASGSSLGSLVDDTGAGTLAGITVAGVDQNNINVVPGSPDPNEEMLFNNKTYGRDAGEGWTIGVTGLSTDYTSAGYDVYVYFADKFLGDISAGRPGVATFDLTIGSTTHFVRSPNHDVDFYDANGFVDASDTNAGDGRTTGNYVVFSGLTGDSFTLTSARIAGSRPEVDTVRHSISGIQIVAVPEPASLALMGLGGLLMLGRARRISE